MRAEERAKHVNALTETSGENDGTRVQRARVP